MKGFKAHLGVVLSLVTLLFSIQFIFFINDAIKEYEKNMRDNYNIIIVSKKALALNDVSSSVNEVEAIEEISGSSVISNLESKISKESIEKLQERLPKFYSIKLKFFPSDVEIKTISEKLKNISDVYRVEIFAKAHDNVYRMLILLKNIVYIFSCLIGILSFMLLLKQMKIWLFEHKQRVEVMTLFGSSFFWKSADLYKMAIIDSILATMIVMICYVFIAKLVYFENIIEIINFNYTSNVLLDYFIYLISVALILSIFSASFVMFDLEKRNKI